jgi:hypothetical protein
MKVPNFKPEKIREDIFELVDMAPVRLMYGIVLKSIDYAMAGLDDIRQEIPKSKSNRSVLEGYDKHFEEFGEREAYYYQAFLDAEDRTVVDAPLFKGDYSDFEFSGPAWPDIETPWRMANELANAAALAGMGQDFQDGLTQRFKNTITEFWAEANRLIVEEKRIAEEQAEAEQPMKRPGNEGRRYGFWPLLALGGAALAGAFGTAAAYSSSKSGDPGEYVDTTWWGKNKAAAKTMGLGFAFGVAAAALVILRVRK